MFRRIRVQKAEAKAEAKAQVKRTQTHGSARKPKSRSILCGAMQQTPKKQVQALNKKSTTELPQRSMIVMASPLEK
jgi:hypothetical protein